MSTYPCVITWITVAQTIRTAD